MTTTERWTLSLYDLAIGRGWRRRCRCHRIVEESIGSLHGRKSRYAYCVGCGRLLGIEEVELPCLDG